MTDAFPAIARRSEFAVENPLRRVPVAQAAWPAGEPPSQPDGHAKEHSAEQHQVPRLPRQPEIWLVRCQRREGHRAADDQQPAVLCADGVGQSSPRNQPRCDVGAPIEPSIDRQCRHPQPTRDAVRRVQVQRQVAPRTPAAPMPRVFVARKIVALIPVRTTERRRTPRRTPPRAQMSLDGSATQLKRNRPRTASLRSPRRRSRTADRRKARPTAPTRSAVTMSTCPPARPRLLTNATLANVEQKRRGHGQRFLDAVSVHPEERREVVGAIQSTRSPSDTTCHGGRASRSDVERIRTPDRRSRRRSARKGGERQPQDESSSV